MKNKILIFSGIVIFIALTAFNSLSKSNKDFIIVRTSEAHLAINIPCAIMISKSDGTTENIELKRYNRASDITIENMKVITNKIIEIQNAGYELKNLSGGGGVEGTVFTYYFEKQ